MTASMIVGTIVAAVVISLLGYVARTLGKVQAGIFPEGQDSLPKVVSDLKDRVTAIETTLNIERKTAAS